MIRAFLIHRFRLLAEALAAAIARCDDIALLGSAEEPDRALEEMGSRQVDIVLIDAALSAEATPEVVRDLRERLPQTKVLPLGLAGSEQVLPLIEAGASGYVSRDASVDHLLDTIRGVQRGQAPCSPQVAASVIARMVELSNNGRHVRRCASASRDVRLTPRETEILLLVAEGLQNKEIAHRLEITLPTVKNHVHKLLEKLQASRRREAIQRAWENGLLEDPLPYY